MCDDPGPHFKVETEGTERLGSGCMDGAGL